MEALSFITPAHIAMVPVVIGLTQAVKNFFETDRWNRFIPLFAIAIGIALSSIIGGGIIPVTVGGIIIGLSACGMYSTGSTLKNG